MRRGERQSAPEDLHPALRRTAAILEFLRTEAVGGIVLSLAAIIGPNPIKVTTPRSNV